MILYWQHVNWHLSPRNWVGGIDWWNIISTVNLCIVLNEVINRHAVYIVLNEERAWLAEKCCSMRRKLDILFGHIVENAWQFTVWGPRAVILNDRIMINLINSGWFHSFCWIFMTGVYILLFSWMAHWLNQLVDLEYHF